MLALALALTLSAAVEQAMRGVAGAAVVVDASTGRTLAAHPSSVARDRAFTPGSTIKPFTLAALIDDERIRPGEPALCDPETRIERRRLECSHPRLTIPLDPASALAYSCNSYFARLALRLDAARFTAALRSFGFAVPLEPPTPAALQLLALGEWGVRITPFELAHAYRRLLARRAEPRLQEIFAGLEQAVEYGSAQLAALDTVRVAGKTGTTASAGRNSTHAWFAGFAPATRPAIVVVVFVERGRGGATAAPIACAIIRGWAESR